MLKRIFPSRKQPISIPIVNKNDSVNNDLTGSLMNITAPAQLTSNSKTRKSLYGQTVFNSKPIQDAFRESIFKYSGKHIHKTISYWNSGSNQLTITGSILDYGTEAVSPDNFEILYNGIHIPGAYTVEQTGGDVVITFQKRYINYDTLVSGSTEINIYGKFK